MTDYTVDELDESLLQLLPELLTPQRPAIRPSRSRSRRTTSGQSSANSNTSSTGQPHRQLSSNSNISGSELTEDNGHISASEQTVQQPVHSIPEFHDQFPANSPPRSNDECPIPRSNDECPIPRNNTAPVKFRVPIRRSNSVYTTTFSFKIKPRNKVTRSSSIGSAHAPIRIKYRAASEMKEMTDDFIKDYLGPGLSKAADLDGMSPRPSPTPLGKKRDTSNNKGLANEAVDALQATEDYSKVKLNKGHTQKAVKEVAGGREQLHDTVLVQIKGKQSMQTRLVAPHFSSLNSYETFLLITPNTLYQFNGKHASVLKKSKGTELVTAITVAREFKCMADKVTVLEQVRGSYLIRHFNKHLKIQNENEEVSEKLVDDEEYEKEQNGANVGYVLDEEMKDFTMIPELSGKRLKHHRLKDSQIYCMDYGPEVYVWIGRSADRGARKNAMIAGRQIWDSRPRPSWGIFQRIAGGLEHSLFREKFKDWPDVNALNVLKVKNPCAPKKDTITFVDMEPCDAEQMRAPLPEAPAGLVLEMTDVGRGDGVPTDLFKDIFGHDVETRSVEMWRITDNSYEEYPKDLYGELYSGESFIIRWAYRVMQGGKKQDHDTGRDRAAFFFWQGADCSIKEKGKSAFLTVRVDSERAPQIQLDQSTEPPAFLQIFDGSMVTFKGKISDQGSADKRRRMFLYRGEVEKEGSLTELPNITSSSLRSRGSFIIQDGETMFYVWHGCKSRAHTVAGSFSAANKLAQRVTCNDKPTVLEVQEGSEGKQFWKCFDGGKQDYFSLLEDDRKYAKSLRLFNLYEDLKQFCYKEIEYNSRAPKVAAPYPFLQSDLYEAEQPALFILDSIYTVYVWKGWWPTHTPDGEVLANTGSAETDFVERYKLTLHTALAYSELETKEAPNMVVVNAGAEPTEFKCLFPWWRDWQDVPSDLPGPTPLDQELKRFLQTEFTLKELQAKPPPVGCDPLRLEQYLSVTEFMAIFNMNKKEFLDLQAWKQRKLKQVHDLF